MHKLLLAGAAATIATAALAAQPAPPTPPGVAQGTTAVRPAPQVQTFVHRLPMKTETRDEVVAHVREMFARLDGNKDGYVTRAEADAAHQAMIGEMHDRFTKRFEKADFPRPDRAAMFDKLDTNKDGSISRQEYMSAKPEIRHESHVFVMRDGEAPVEVGAAGHVPGTPEGPARVTILQDGAPPLEMNSRPGEPGAKGIRMHGMRMGMHGRMFEEADANHDGKVSQQEMTDLALKHFDSADANHDGKLTPDERMKMHEERRVEIRRIPA